MIALFALPFSVRNILDRVCQSGLSPALHYYACLLFSGEESAVASTLRRADPHRRAGFSRWRAMFAAPRNWSSVLPHGETGWCDRTNQFRRFCRDCEEDTAHDEFDEFGPGWYAQICRCRRCGREGMRIWPLACW